MHILLNTPEFPPQTGGIGNSAHRLARAFASAGHAVTVLTHTSATDLRAAPSIQSSELEGLAVQVLRVGPIAARAAAADSEATAFLWRQFIVVAVERLKSAAVPDVVLSLGLIEAGFAGLCISQALSRPHVVSARGADIGTQIFQNEKFAQAAWTVSRSAAVTFVNQYLFDVAALVFGASSHFKVIHNGISDPLAGSTRQRQADRQTIRKQLGIPTQAKVIGWTGTFREKKGIPYLDRAFRALVEQGRDVYLMIVGGPRNDQARKLCSLLDDRDAAGRRVRCIAQLGGAEAVYPYYSAMDAFAYPSTDDGLSNALLEAMAFGLPIVTTDIFADVTGQGRAALMVKRFDADALAEALCRIFDDPRLAQRLGEEARRLALNEFSAFRERDAYLGLFASLLQTAT